MDYGRSSATYPRPSSLYYDHDYHPLSSAPLSNKKQSFSARAGRELPYGEQPSSQGNGNATGEAYGNDNAPRSRRSQAPAMASVNAPTKSRRQQENMQPPPKLNTHVTRSQRHALSPTSPLSPNDPLATRGDRRGSVPDRSPLQRLEGKLGDISKEEKRARMEEAEHRALQREAANQSRRMDEGSVPYPAQAPTYPPNRTGSARRREERRYSSAPEPLPPDPRYTRDAPVESSGQLFTSQPIPRSHQTDDVDPGTKFRRASDALRMQSIGQDTQDQITAPRAPLDARRDEPPTQDNSIKYRHRARDAGFAGAAAAITRAQADRGLGAVHDRNSKTGVSRENRRKVKSGPAGQLDPTQVADAHQGSLGRAQLQSDRMGSAHGLKHAIEHEEPDPLPRDAVHDSQAHGPSYRIPPQTAGGQDARQQVGFADVTPVVPENPPSANPHHTLWGALAQRNRSGRTYRKTAELEEWRGAGVAKLTAEDLVINQPADGRNGRDTAWWERDSRRRSSGADYSAPAAYDGPYDEEAVSFRPYLFLKCGPLLRYTGIRREQGPGSRGSQREREIWRGSVMIVSLDSHSSYESVPILRIFAQPMDLMQSPPADLQSSSYDLPSEYVDPVAGQVKVSRTGRPLFVKPVDQLEDGIDLSRVEDDTGLFQINKPTNPGPPQGSGPDARHRQNTTAHNGSRVRAHDGEKAGKYREVRGLRLNAERGVTFWRFNIEIELAAVQTRVAYRINGGPATGFWVPARGDTMNIMFHSCNGFSLSVDSNTFTGPDPLWRDVLNRHQFRPFHVMIGGGDQIYNDAAMRDTVLFRDWLQTKNPEHKHKAEFSEDMQNELEDFYLDRYSMWFSQGLFSMANSQIPMVNIWDDHDIIDGYGSYPHHFMRTSVFTGLGAVAFKYYMLFQHQSVVSETSRDEPSWLLGASPGPYINELSRSVFVSLGRKVTLLGLDCRTERMRDEILSQESYDLIFDRCRAEIMSGNTKHLIVLLGVPIAYPRLNFLENILTSRIMDPIKAIGRTGVLGGFVNKFDGGVEILDDLDDHWTAKHHKAERNWFVQELQELAAEKSVRVTILGGDVHLGAVGQFYTTKKLGVPKDRDHRYMPNVISSAIVNTPPPAIMGDVLNKRNKIHHLDQETDEDMIPMFERDVDGKPRNNQHLLPRRNYCIIREYQPGLTPPPSPRLEAKRSSWSQPQSQQNIDNDRRYPPGSMKRTLSMKGGNFRPGNLVRRLSGSRTRERPSSADSRHAGQGLDGEAQRAPGSAHGDLAGSRGPSLDAYGDSARPRFLRRPTDLSEKAARKAAAKGGAEGNLEGREPGHIDLEGGLDISLRMEIDQKDPAGLTVPYRLLVPALWYEGQPDINTARFKSRGPSLMDRLRGRHEETTQYPYSDSGSENRSRTPSPESMPPGRYDGPTHATVSGAAPPRHSIDQRPAFPRDTAPPPITTQQPPRKEYFPAPSPATAPVTRHASLRNANRDDNQPPQQNRSLFGFRRRRDTDRDEGYGRERYGADSASEGDSLMDDRSDDEGFSEQQRRPVATQQQTAYQQQQGQQQQRRPSKAERFFGAETPAVGGGGGVQSQGRGRAGSAPVQQQQPQLEQTEIGVMVGPNGVPYWPKQKRGWKIWK